MVRLISIYLLIDMMIGTYCFGILLKNVSVWLLHVVSQTETNDTK